jgi:NADH:ubiquinone oxidoreductase subunit 2 (subunit N)
MLGIFLSLSAFRYYQYPKHYQIRYIKDFKGLSYFNPVLSLTLSIFLFSMAGIPPLVGFFAKLFVLLAALQNNSYALAVFAVIMSCIACFYYIRLIKIMYFENLPVWTVSYSISKSTSLFLGLFTFLVMFLFVDLEHPLKVARGQTALQHWDLFDVALRPLLSSQQESCTLQL